MNILLDTHILLWWLADSSKLSAKARAAIAGSEMVYVSAASAWEIEIKKARGRLSAPNNLEATLRAYQLIPLPITVSHAIAAAGLPKHHNDPFDRMLIAQAVTESLTLLTVDVNLTHYDVPLMLV